MPHNYNNKSFLIKKHFNEYSVPAIYYFFVVVENLHIVRLVVSDGKIDDISVLPLNYDEHKFAKENNSNVRYYTQDEIMKELNAVLSFKIATIVSAS